MPINEEKLNELIHKAMVDFGATMHAGLVIVGEKLGLYKTLAEYGPMTPHELAEKTGTAERYIREWLSAQAAGGYVQYHQDIKKFSLSEEQAFVLVDEESPAYLPGAFLIATAALKSKPKLLEAFKTGQGVGWDEHDPMLFQGCEKFFRPSYAANLVSSWIPSLTGVEEKLKSGAKVADVGCGHGASTILMAQAYPESTFIGFDFHEASIGWARKKAEEKGVADRVKFEVAKSSNFPGKNFDFVTLFDCLHDMGDPIGAVEHIRGSLNSNGTMMLVEPFAGDDVEHNLNPIGRAFYSVSTLVCTPASLAQEVGYGLGAQAGEFRLKEVATKAGFTRFRRAAETPFNLIFEASP